MLKPQDLRRTNSGDPWTIWLLKTREAVEDVTADGYLNNVYTQMRVEDELIIRVKNKKQHYRLHLVIQEVDMKRGNVKTITIHEIDLTTGEEIEIVGEAQEAGASG